MKRKLAHYNLPHIRKFRLSPNHPLAAYINNEQLMQYLQLSKRSLQHWRSKRMIPYSKINGIIFYRIKDVLTLLERNKIAALQRTPGYTHRKT